MNRLQLQALSGVPLAIDEDSIHWLHGALRYASPSPKLQLSGSAGARTMQRLDLDLAGMRSLGAEVADLRHYTPSGLFADTIPDGETRGINSADIIAANNALQSAREGHYAVSRSGQVAVLPVVGVMDQRPGWFSDVSTDRFQSHLKELAGSKDVRTIVLDVDSPGGSVFGVEEAAQTMREVRAAGTKIVAVANSWAASAAYYLASQADELVVTPGGMVGSIGVYSLHIDASTAIEEAGFKVTLVKAGKYKAEGNEFEPLGDDAKDEMQRVVDAYYAQFVKAVAKGRGVTPAEVREKFGQGRMVLASDAVKLGMADRVDTLANTLDRLSARRGSPGRARAEMERLDLSSPGV